MKILHKNMVIGFWRETWEKIKLRRPRRRWEHNIKMGLQKVGWGLDWIDVAQNRDGGEFLCMP